jgi:transglutaminase/protease-like cytokinesis protein 3
MQRRQQIGSCHTKRIKQVLCVIVILIVILTVVFLITRLHGTGRQTDRPSGAESTATVRPSAVSTASGAVAQKTSDVSAPQTASHPAVKEKTHWNFQEVLLPQYIKDFLPENGETDYRNIITALYNGESSVQLTAISTQKEWEKIRRAVQLTFPPRALLYDAQYHNNMGPFSFDKKTRVLTIRYGWEQDIPSVADRDAYLLEVDAFRQNVTEIFDRYVTDASDAESTAGELFDYVVLALRYDYDMKLELYDAFTEHTAYCQTYSQMYQYLMWQAGYECWLYSGDQDHEWNVIWLDGIPYQVDTTWQSPDYADRFFFAMSDAAAEATGHGSTEKFFRCDALCKSTDERVYCTDVRFDEIYRKDITSTPE